VAWELSLTAFTFSIDSLQLCFLLVPCAINQSIAKVRVSRVSAIIDEKWPAGAQRWMGKKMVEMER